MTFESSLPYLSVAAGLGAGAWAGTPRRRLTAALSALALGALALFAYFRWISPTEAPLGLALGAAGLALLPPEPSRWRRPAIALLAGEWLVFASLFLKTGDGLGQLMADAARAALAVGSVIAVALLLRRLWPGLQRPRSGAAGEMVALTLMLAASLTLDWSFWPAMAGTAAVTAGEGVLLAVAAGRLPQRPALVRVAWALGYVGQAAMAYAFLR